MNTSRTSFGFNFAGYDNWSPVQPYANVAMTASLWYAAGTNTASAVDPLGNPTEDAWCYLFQGQPNTAGVYECRFSSAGTPACSFGTVSGISTANGVTSFTLALPPAAEGQNVSLTITGTTGGIQSLQVMRPGHDFSDRFNKAVVALATAGTSLRFMDFVGTVGSKLAHWADRPTPALTCLAYSKGGAPIEDAIAFAALTGTHPHIPIPELADADYVRQKAMLEQLLMPAWMHLSWEDGNEPWNWGQPGFATASALLTSGDPISAAVLKAFPNEGTGEYNVLRRWALRTVEHSEIYRSVWGDAAMPEQSARVRPCYFGQQAQAWTTACAFDAIFGLLCGGYKTGVTVPGIPVRLPSAYLYGVGCSAYYSTSYTTPPVTVDDCFGLAAVNDFAGWSANLRQHAQVSAAMGCRMVAYEGGWALNETGGAKNNVTYPPEFGAKFDPRCMLLIERLHDEWEMLGGDVLYHEAMNGGLQGWVNWGFYDDMAQTSTLPKARAAAAVLAGPSQQITGYPRLGDTVHGGDALPIGTLWSPMPKGAPITMTPGMILAWTFYGPVARLYDWLVHLAGSGSLDVWVGGRARPPVTVSSDVTAPIAGWGGPYCRAGLVTLVLRCTAGSVTVNTLQMV